jgi:alpha-N-arabinofuranosidase
MTTLKLTINTYNKKDRINPEIYGSFSEHLGRCIYDGIFVGDNKDIPNTNGIRNDIVEALKAINLPVLRWPGGCFADEYHWRNGIGDKNKRKNNVNTHWGGVVEDNSFGTHEFMQLCEMIGCQPYIAGNLGSGTVQEMSEWIEYITATDLSSTVEERIANGRKEPWKLKYFGIGNENWACGGNMRPEFYADQYRRYATYCRNYGANRLYKIACGPNSDDYNWTDKIMGVINSNCDAISLHHYSWFTSKRATELSEDDYMKVIWKSRNMDDLIKRHRTIMAKYDPEKKIKLVVDEWGTWYKTEEGTNPRFLHQQSTMTDALVAAGTLDIFNSHCDIVSMANIAQTVNVLQAVILTHEEKMIKTPTYHVFDLYSRHMGSRLLDSYCENKKLKSEDTVYAISHSASVNEDGLINVTLSNTSLDEDFEIDMVLFGKLIMKVDVDILHSKSHLSHNTFDNPENVRINKYDEYRIEKNGLKIKIPPCSVVAITIR